MLFHWIKHLPALLAWISLMACRCHGVSPTRLMVCCKPSVCNLFWPGPRKMPRHGGLTLPILSSCAYLYCLGASSQRWRGCEHLSWMFYCGCGQTCANLKDGAKSDGTILTVLNRGKDSCFLSMDLVSLRCQCAQWQGEDREQKPLKGQLLFPS